MNAIIRQAQPGDVAAASRVARAAKAHWGYPLRVESDPHAAGFYARAGAVQIGDVAAAIPGEPLRTLPLFEFRSVTAAQRR